MAWNFDRVIYPISRLVFYPKELKVIVNELKENNNLNPIPLKELDRYHVFFICLLLLIFSTVFFREDETIITVIFIFVAFISHCLILKYDVLKMYKAYVYGTKYDGVIVGRSYPKLGTTVLWCERTIDGEVVKLSATRPTLGKESGIEIGKPISYYYSEEYNTKKLPDIERLRARRCLRKDLL